MFIIPQELLNQADDGESHTVLREHMNDTISIASHWEEIDFQASLVQSCCCEHQLIFDD